MHLQQAKLLFQKVGVAHEANVAAAAVIVLPYRVFLILRLMWSNLGQTRIIFKPGLTRLTRPGFNADSYSLYFHSMYVISIEHHVYNSLVAYIHTIFLHWAKPCTQSNVDTSVHCWAVPKYPSWCFCLIPVGNTMHIQCKVYAAI